jgi:hypothetical protein
MVEVDAGPVRTSTRAAAVVAICSLVAFVVETQMTKVCDHLIWPV